MSAVGNSVGAGLLITEGDKGPAGRTEVPHKIKETCPLNVRVAERETEQIRSQWSPQKSLSCGSWAKERICKMLACGGEGGSRLPGIFWGRCLWSPLALLRPMRRPS